MCMKLMFLAICCFLRFIHILMVYAQNEHSLVCWGGSRKDIAWVDILKL
uniref:Uncharacterized protein n=1 Tax=Arundo donax TaxID=35708 RepID=A0A0A9E806_ARUDO